MFSTTIETSKGVNNGFIAVKNGMDSHSKLQYKLDLDENWLDYDGSDKISNLVPNIYVFNELAKDDKKYVEKH